LGLHGVLEGVQGFFCEAFLQVIPLPCQGVIVMIHYNGNKTVVIRLASASHSCFDWVIRVTGLDRQHISHGRACWDLIHSVVAVHLTVLVLLLSQNCWSYSTCFYNYFAVSQLAQRSTIIRRQLVPLRLHSRSSRATLSSAISVRARPTTAGKGIALRIFQLAAAYYCYYPTRVQAEPRDSEGPDTKSNSNKSNFNTY
jgi:hypothetical protein